MSASAIAKRYAKALVSLADEEGGVERFQEVLTRIGETFTSAPELVSVLSDPAHPADAKKTILSEVLDRLDVPPTVRNFMLLLQERGRLSIFSQICAAYRALADERGGIVRARVTVPIDPTPARIEELKQALSKLTAGKRVDLTVDVDPDIIGGIVTRIGDMVFDGSVRTELERIQDTLTKG